MANAYDFINSYSANIQTLVRLLDTLNTQNQQMTDDTTLVSRYFSASSPPPRTDINATDVSNAQSALVQLLFTYNSGSPSQASFLLKMMP